MRSAAHDGDVGAGWRRALLVALLVAAAVPRLATLERQGLWTDEIFTLAMATGHSLEHPAGVADPHQGDFVEYPEPVHAARYRAFLEHEPGGAPPGRVVRAVFLSDTSPPLYYLLASGWTRVFGTGDSAVRLLSVTCALACIPLLWLIGTRVGGPWAAALGCFLFAAAPFAIRYSTEARMYALVWLLALLATWIAIQLHDRGPRAALMVAWVLVSAAGLLTHYFFVFAWAPILGWLLWQPNRCDRRVVGLGIGVVLLLIMPWYARLPASLANWRVTGDWLLGGPGPYRIFRTPFELAWSYFAAQPFESVVFRRRHVAAAAAAAAVLLALASRQRDRRLLILLALSMAGACVGPLVFDLARGTHASTIARYALPGLPAAMLLAGAALARIPAPVSLALAALLLVSWAPGFVALGTAPARGRSPLREVARQVSATSSQSDLILVHGIPSAVLGVARYLESPAPMAAWVGQLGQRTVPTDVETLAEGRQALYLVKIATVGAPAPQEQFLRARAVVASDSRLLSSHTVVFLPREAPRFTGARLSGAVEVVE